MGNKNTEITKDILCVGRVIVEVIKAQINGEKYQFSEDCDFSKVYKLSEKHKVTPLVAPSVIACEYASDDIKATFKKELFRSTVRYTSQIKETEELSELLVKQGIKYCFLKGSKISKYYDNPDMRFMADTDVYIESGKSEAAAKILLERGYKYESYEDEKDAGYIKKPFFFIELHKELKYDYDKGYEYYKGAFDRMVVDEDGCTMNMTNEDFYVYILSHLAHHFETAGTGIKSIVDHYYLKKKLRPQCDESVLAKAFEEIGLTVFNSKIDQLADYWFENAEASDSVEEIANYVILSGVFGNETNYYLSGIIRGNYTEKKSSYFLSRIFLPYRIMKNRYPVLKKLPFLLPVMWVVRLLSSLTNLNKHVEESNTIKSIDNAEKDKQLDFLKRNGL